jgi:hypothetical protein
MITTISDIRKLKSLIFYLKQIFLYPVPLYRPKVKKFLTGEACSRNTGVCVWCNRK